VATPSLHDVVQWCSVLTTDPGELFIEKRPSSKELILYSLKLKRGLNQDFALPRKVSTYSNKISEGQHHRYPSYFLKAYLQVSWLLWGYFLKSLGENEERSDWRCNCIWILFWGMCENAQPRKDSHLLSYTSSK